MNCAPNSSRKKNILHYATDYVFSFKLRAGSKATSGSVIVLHDLSNLFVTKEYLHILYNKSTCYDFFGLVQHLKFFNVCHGKV